MVMSFDDANMDVLQAFRQFKIGMADTNKRTLRERRLPKNYQSDNEEQDPWGYAKPTYSRPSTQQDLRNPAPALNSQAKILVQFLSSINKKLKEYMTAHPQRCPPPPEERPIQQQLKYKVGQGGSEPSQRVADSRQTRLDSSKQKKEPQSIRAQINGLSVSYARNQSLLNQCKALNAESRDKILDIEKSMKNQTPSESQASRLQNKKMNYQTHTPNPPKKQQATSKNGPKINSQPLAQSTVINQTKDNAQKTDTPSSASKSTKSTGTENKIFKRSAYHVAIAYHIYLKNMRQRGAVQSQIDPTFHARRMRQSIKK